MLQCGRSNGGRVGFIARSPLGEIARETLTFVIDGAKQPVEIERQERPRGARKATGFVPCAPEGAARYSSHRLAMLALL